MVSKYKYLIKKGVSNIKQNGVQNTFLKCCSFFSQHKDMRLHSMSQEELIKRYEECTPVSGDIKFSILVPLYNTPDTFLKEMIESVQNQIYLNWELCLADGSNADHPTVMEICKQYSSFDNRIKYRNLEENLGISGNSNECLKMATGEYITLFDHDDLLHPAALCEVAKVIAEQGADFVYTDEAVFVDDLKNIISVHRKPDYAPDNLRANNYICHLTTFSKKLLEKTEGFRSKYDGSQDHDLILRLTGVAENIMHIPKILYFWRSHAESVASGIGAKSYAVQAGQNAVKDYLDSIGQPCTIESLDFCPTIYRVKYELLNHPLVSIVLKVDTVKDIAHYIENVISKDSYSNCDYYFLCKNEELIIELRNRLSKLCKYYAAVYNRQASYSKCLNDLVENEVQGEYIVLMEQWLTPLSNNWVEELLMYAQREDVGIVGSKVYYKNGLIKSAGIAFEEKSSRKKIKRLYKYCDKNAQGYMGKLQYAQNIDAVTSDCIMLKKEVFCNIAESFATLEIAVIDLCIHLSTRKLFIVWNSCAEFYFTPTSFVLKKKHKKYSDTLLKNVKKNKGK